MLLLIDHVGIYHKFYLGKSENLNSPQIFLLINHGGVYCQFYPGKSENLISRMFRCVHQKGLLTLQRPISISAEITYKVTFCFINLLVSFDNPNGYLSFWHIYLMCHMPLLY